jgi:hypothetical protein
MFDLSDPKMFWLNVANIGLGIVTLGCWVVVAYGVVQEALMRKLKSKITPVISDDHSFLIPGLGVTLADGGKRIDKASSTDFEKRTYN